MVYSYTNADWGDLLTSYDGKPITYDQIGNPLRIGSCRYSWEHGRQLASMFDGQNTAWHFTYDASGMRTSRSNGTTTYSYVYNGGLLMKMTVSNVVLEFAYDAFGAPMTITLNGSRYYYLTNVQGDVVSIVDADGVLQFYPFTFCISSAFLARMMPLLAKKFLVQTVLFSVFIQENKVKTKAIGKDSSLRKEKKKAKIC